MAKLIDMAQSETEKNEIHPDDPAPLIEFLGLAALPLFAKQIKCSLWGKPNALTFSISKNDVWDRRVITETPLKFKELSERAYKDGWDNEINSLYYKAYSAYGFPCPKPVGQLIIKSDCLACDEKPIATTYFSNGVTNVRVQNGKSLLEFDFVNMMTQNMLVLDLKTENINKLDIRLYRHLDSFREYNKSFFSGTEFEPKSMEGFDYEKDIPFNNPIEAPTCGVDEDIVFIRQKFPSEKTFPDGFEYIFAAKVSGAYGEFKTHDGFNLGTAPYITKERYEKSEKDSVENFFIHSGCAPQYGPIRDAWGVSTDICLTLEDNSRFSIFATVVTTIDQKDDKNILTIAKERLNENLSANELFIENSGFYNDLYSKREKGRTFFLKQTEGTPEKLSLPHVDFKIKTPSEVKKAFTSWTLDHSGNTAADPFLYQSDNSYAFMQSDYCPWHGDIHFNEVSPTPYCVVGQFERLIIWEKLLNKLLPAAKQNAKEVYEKNGACYGLSYVPVDMDGIYHTHEVWESSLEMNAQNILSSWRCFEYSGDIGYLERIWEPLYESAKFYSEMVTLLEDNKYHIIPTVSAEHHGFTKNFEHNKDSTSALCLFKWNFEAVVEAVNILGYDNTAEIEYFAHIAKNMADYPTYEVDGLKIFVDVQDSTLLDYNLTAPLYPLYISDHIHLDSDRDVFKMAVDTANTINGWGVSHCKMLLGIDKGTSPEHLINSRGGDIHLFPSVELNAEIGFKSLFAKGGFEVSAVYSDKKAKDITILSKAGSVCRVVLPQSIQHAVVENTITSQIIEHKVITPKHLKERIEFETVKGFSYSIEAD